MQPASQTTAHYRWFSQPCASHFTKTKWALYRKSEVEALLDETAVANQDPDNFVNAIRESRKDALPTHGLAHRPLEDVKVIRDSYSRIYTALSAIWQDCGYSTHDVELALQCEVDQDPAGSLRELAGNCPVVFHAGPLSKCCYAVCNGKTEERSIADTSVSQDANLRQLETGRSVTFKGTVEKDAEREALSDAHSTSRMIGSICSNLQALGWSARTVQECHLSASSEMPPSLPPNDFHVSSCCSHFNGISLSGSGAHAGLTRLMRYPYQSLRLACALALFTLRLYSSPWLERTAKMDQ